MNKEKVLQILAQKEIQDTMLAELKLSASERASRYLRVRPHAIIPDTYFASASAECSLMFRDGYFYGCISLTQAVTEAIVRFMCKTNSFKSSKSLADNVERLCARKFISVKIKESILGIWENRDDYHHLNPSIHQDREKLEVLAERKLKLLNEVEGEIYNFTTYNGAFIPKQPKFWTLKPGKIFLRCE